jgi:hypothetical protein
MKVLHKNKTDNTKIEPEEGQRSFLCGNKSSYRCPSLCYNYIESPDNLNKAFEILFEEVMRLRKIKKDHEKTNSNILKSINVEAGRRTNN